MITTKLPDGSSRAERRALRLRDLRSPRYRHLLLLLFWPAELLLFELTERLPLDYRPVSCALDLQIPFCECFVVPYLLWFLTWTGMLLFLLLRDVPVFRRTMWYFIISISLAFCVFLLWPNYCPLRPDPLPDRGLCAWLVRLVYAVDRPTDACPSLHVVVALGVCFSAWHARGISRPVALVLTLHCLLICASVTFIKQHSLVDVAVAVPFAALGYLLCFVPARCPLWARQPEPDDAGSRSA